MLIICISITLRGRMFNTIIHPQPLRHANGAVFVSNCDGVLRLFDIRSSVTGMLLLPAKYIFSPKLPLYLLCCISFSVRFSFSSGI